MKFDAMTQYLFIARKDSRFAGRKYYGYYQRLNNGQVANKKGSRPKR